jgi:hypothetical protein
MTMASIKTVTRGKVTSQFSEEWSVLSSRWRLPWVERCDGRWYKEKSRYFSTTRFHEHWICSTVPFLLCSASFIPS